MIFTIDKIIAYVSRYMTLKIGDLIYTGTPSGVGTVAIGDNLRGRFTIKIENIEEFYQRVDKYIEENFNKDLFIKKLKIEKILAPYKVNYKFLKELEILGDKTLLQPTLAYTDSSTKASGPRRRCLGSDAGMRVLV